MSRKKHGSSSYHKFTFGRNTFIGTPDAESDTLLNRVYIDNDGYDALVDVNNPKCLIVGRTGSGKSALIKKIEQNENKIKRIAPESMSIRYLSNSTILDYLRSINVNLNLFYKILWKHVFIIEILKIYVDDSEEKKSSFLKQLRENITNKWGKKDIAKEQAIEYLEKWSSDKFWLTSEHRIKTLENRLEEKISAEIGVDLHNIKLGATGDQQSSSSSIAEVKHKAERVISEFHAESLYNIVDLLKSDIFDSNQKRYFVVIDDLDKDWVSQQIVYDLIAAMIEVVKEFQADFKGVKIILALRVNLHQLVLTGKEHRGGQREKYSSMYLNLSWSREDLIKILNKRISTISNNSVTIYNLFEKNSIKKQDALNYILDRTFERPRDIISYINKIIEQANNKSQFNSALIKKAEPYYSTERMHALEDEWEENYGKFEKICIFLYGKNNGFNIINIKEDDFADVYFNKEFSNQFKGQLFNICFQLRNEEINFERFKQELFFILYTIGIIGIKRRPQSKQQFFYNEIEIIKANDFDNQARIYVHKSLYSYFKIIDKEQELDHY